MIKPVRKFSVSLPVEHKPDLLNTTTAQELLKDDARVEKAGFLNLKFKHAIKHWKPRFVVATKDHLVIYTKETSQHPQNIIPLLGYQGVERSMAKSSKVTWVFQILRSPPSSKLRPELRFSCSSEEERFSWMTAIKNVLYSANFIEQPRNLLDEEVENLLHLKEKRLNSSSSEDAYIELEKLVFTTTNTSMREDYDNVVIPIEPHGQSSSEGEDTEDEEEEEEPDEGLETSNRGSLTSFHSQNGPGDRYNISHHRPRRNSLPLPAFLRKQESNEVKGNQESNEDEVDKRIYQNLLQIKRENESDYATVKSVTSLESMCSAVNSTLSRDELISILKTTTKGTYLIRKSRHTNAPNVLSCYFGNDKVGEFQIYEELDKTFTLDHKHYFDCLDSLLRAYTVQMTLPNCDQKLRRGVYKVRSSSDDDDEGVDLAPPNSEVF